MLLSIGIVFILGMLFGWIFKKLNLPGLLGMLIVGILLGPYSLNILSDKLILISADLRKIALIIILTRAGLNLNINELKRVGRSAALLCFLPALAEICGAVLIAPRLLNLSIAEAAVLGSVTAAVSPAVVVPKMLKLMQEKYGTDKGIPQMIMAGASVDDIFVIVLFTSFVSVVSGNNVNFGDFLKIPVSIITGIAVGCIFGAALSVFFKKFHIRDSLKVLIILSLSFILVSAEDVISSYIGFSGLLAVMAFGIVFNRKNKQAAERVSVKYSKLWIGAEIMLFVLVGAEVNISYALRLGVVSVVAIFLLLIFRMAGVFVCMLKTELNFKQRLFCMISYSPKATVQAAIGAIPLSMGLSCGDTVLCVAVISILITAPLGAFFIDFTYKKLLNKSTA